MAFGIVKTELFIIVTFPAAVGKKKKNHKNSKGGGFDLNPPEMGDMRTEYAKTLI